MKKVLAFLLVASLCLCFLTCCNMGDNEEGGKKENEIGNLYSVKVTGDKDSLMQPIMPFYRAGTTVEIKAHPVTDISLHVFVNGKEIPMSHFDSDYWGFEFVMPEEKITIHLTYDQFYGKEEYAFHELDVRIAHLKNEITKVSIRTTDYTEKYNLIETKYSFKQDDIDAFKAIVDQKLLKADNIIASQATRKSEYGFYCTTDSQEEEMNVLKFNDTFFTWNDFSSWQAFAFENKNYILPTITDPDFVTYSFKYDGRSSDVKKYGDESFLLNFFEIGSVEFIPYTPADQTEPFKEAVYYLDSGYGKINLLTATVFEWNGEYYQIVSGEEYWAYTYLQLESK